MALLSILPSHLFPVVIAVLCSASVATSAATSNGEVSPAVPVNPNVWKPKT